MKKLLITRLIPEANIAFARARFDVTLRETAVGLTPDEDAKDEQRKFDGVQQGEITTPQIPDVNDLVALGYCARTPQLVLL